MWGLILVARNNKPGIVVFPIFFCEVQREMLSGREAENNKASEAYKAAEALYWS